MAQRVSFRVPGYFGLSIIFNMLLLLVIAFVIRDHFTLDQYGIYQEEMKQLLVKVWAESDPGILRKINYILTPLDWWHLIRHNFIY